MWIQTIWHYNIWHYDSVPENFLKTLILKKVSRRQQRHEKLPTMQRVKRASKLDAKSGKYSIWVSTQDFGTLCISKQLRLIKSSQRIHAVSSEPPFLTYTKYGSKNRLWTKVKLLAPLDTSAWVLMEALFVFLFYFWLFCLIWFFMSQSTNFQLCQDGVLLGCTSTKQG